MTGEGTLPRWAVPTGKEADDLFLVAHQMVTDVSFPVGAGHHVGAGSDTSGNDADLNFTGSVSGYQVVGVEPHTRGVDVTAVLPKVPVRNLCGKPRAEFGRVWAEVERAGVECGPGDWYLTGVVITFRWVARRPVKSPVTDKVVGPYPETLDSEYMAAIRASHDVRLHPMRVAKARGAAAVLRWLRERGPEPLAGVPLQRMNSTGIHGQDSRAGS